MVFCGKASKGCDGCRRRRIKCDLIKPACSQCRRAGKTCSGYRDQLDLLFRDENSKVLSKVRLSKIDARKEHLRDGPDPADQKDALISSGSKRSPTDGLALEVTLTPSQVEDALADQTEPELIEFLRYLAQCYCPTPMQLADTVETTGIRFFFMNYVSVIGANEAGHLIPEGAPLWISVLRDQSFADAVTAIGLSGLANVTHDSTLMVVARRKYALTIDHVKFALQNPSQRGFDYAFKAVMTLAIFEIVNCPNVAAASAWGVHVNGAAALLGIIISSRSKRKPPFRMQVQFGFTTFINYFHIGEPLPKEMIQWSKFKNAGLLRDAPASLLIAIIIRFITMHKSVKEGHLMDSQEIVRQAAGFDAELEEWAASLPESWHFDIEDAAPEDGCVFDQKKHVYKDAWKARIYNHYRWVRIILNEFLLEHLDRSQMFTPSVQGPAQQALGVMSTMATDICVSVSHQFIRFGPQERQLFKVPQMSGVFLLLFPLSIAGGTTGVRDEIYEFSVQTLQDIAHKMGILHAQGLAENTMARHAQWKLAASTVPPPVTPTAGWLGGGVGGAGGLEVPVGSWTLALDGMEELRWSGESEGTEEEEGETSFLA